MNSDTRDTLVHLRERFTRTASSWTSAGLRLGRAFVADWRRNPPQEHAAALAYYAAFALAPALLLLLRILSWWLGTGDARRHIFKGLEYYAGSPTANTVISILRSVPQRGGTVVTLIAAPVLLFAAFRVFTFLQDDLNRAWHVPVEGNRSREGRIHRRVVSFLMVLSAGALLLTSILISAVLGSIEHWFATLTPAADTFEALNILLSFGLLTLVLATLYKFVPDTRVEWSDVWAGAIAASVCLSIARVLLGLYFHWSTIGSAYVAAGSALAFILWLYVSALIVMLGARISRIYADLWGSASDKEHQPDTHHRDHAGGERDHRPFDLKSRGELHGAS
jgi:membrane protein